MLKLGYILTEQGLLNDDQLQTVLELQKMTGKKLGELIIEKGMLSDIQIMKALELQCKIPYVDLTDIHADPKALSLIGEEYARKFCAIPISLNGDQLIVAINDPLDYILVDEISYLTSKKILPRLSTRRQILAAIDANYNLAADQLSVHKSEHELEKKIRKAKAAVEPKPETTISEDVKVPAPAPVIIPVIPTPAPVEKVTIPVPAPVIIPVVPTPAPVEQVTIPVPAPVPVVAEPAVEPPVSELPITTIAEDRLSDQGGFMLDFTKSVKQHFPVNMIDHQMIRVRMPTKRAFTALIELQRKLDQLITMNTSIAAQLDEVYDLCATVLSNNLDQKEIGSEYLSDLLDLEDLKIFAKAYTGFVNSVLNSPGQ